jgi:hypothetical protein
MSSVIDRVATFVFCLSALSFGWWMGGGFASAGSEVTPQPQAASRYFLCTAADEDCDEAYNTYLDAEKARALSWRHGGP